jgi:glyoxylase-like metal-dependent hydrolase (beta-lactamase superfamily II)
VKIIALEKSKTVYTCNSYLILGNWNRIEDVNTVIDPGSDGFILDEIGRISTGVGKTPVVQVILTHNHFDHASGIKALKERYNLRVLAFSEGPLVDELLTDGQIVKAGDGVLEVLHTPGHSTDSICLYAPAEKVLFSGDTQVSVKSPGGSFPLEYVAAMHRLGTREIQRIYTGHDGAMPRVVRKTASLREGLLSFAVL